MTILAEYVKFNTPKKIIDKERSDRASSAENFKKAVLAGVKIALELTRACIRTGGTPNSSRKMVEWGYDSHGHSGVNRKQCRPLLERSDRLDHCRKYADIVAVDGDPLQNVSLLENIGFVMKGGAIYKNTLAK
jgi:hypothetical protein